MMEWLAPVKAVIQSWPTDTQVGDRYILGCDLPGQDNSIIPLGSIVTYLACLVKKVETPEPNQALYLESQATCIVCVERNPTRWVYFTGAPDPGAAKPAPPLPGLPWDGLPLG